MNHKIEPIIFDEALTTHPFFSYAQEAFSIIDRRFPEGAGDKNNDRSMTAPSSEYHAALIKKLNIFDTFSNTNFSEEYDFAGLITGLTSGSADILSCYALGHLRTTFPEARPYFSLVAIRQTVDTALTPFFVSHCLLLISSTPISNKYGLIHNNNALLCDLWSREMYLATSLPQQQARHTLVTISARCKNPFELGEETTSFCVCDYLNGAITLMPVAAWNKFYKKFQKMAISSPPLKIEEPSPAPVSSKPGISSVTNKSVFTHARSIWERKNSTMIGYFCDEQGSYHPIRRVNHNTQFGYWDPHTDRMQLVLGITKNEYGTYYYNEAKLLQNPPSAPKINRSEATANRSEEEHCVVPDSTL